MKLLICHNAVVSYVIGRISPYIVIVFWYFSRYIDYFAENRILLKTMLEYMQSWCQRLNVDSMKASVLFKIFVNGLKFCYFCTLNN